MADLFEVTIEEQIACVERELGFRHHVYPRLIENGKMHPDKADREIEIMGAIFNTLEQLRGKSNDEKI